MWFVLSLSLSVSLSLNGAGKAGWMDERGAGGRKKGRPQSKSAAQRERSFVAQVGYESAFISGWLSSGNGVE